MRQAIVIALAALAMLAVAGCYPEGTRWPTETGVRAP